MSDSESENENENEAERYLSDEEIREFLQKVEEEKERLIGRSGKHWKPMVFEEVLEPEEAPFFQPGFAPRTRQISQEQFSSPADLFD